MPLCVIAAHTSHKMLTVQTHHSALGRSSQQKRYEKWNSNRTLNARIEWIRVRVPLSMFATVRMARWMRGMESGQRTMHYGSVKMESLAVYERHVLQCCRGRECVRASERVWCARVSLASLLALIRERCTAYVSRHLTQFCCWTTSSVPLRLSCGWSWLFRLFSSLWTAQQC